MNTGCPTASTPATHPLLNSARHLGTATTREARGLHRPLAARVKRGYPLGNDGDIEVLDALGLLRV